MSLLFHFLVIFLEYFGILTNILKKQSVNNSIQHGNFSFYVDRSKNNASIQLSTWKWALGLLHVTHARFLCKHRRKSNLSNDLL